MSETHPRSVRSKRQVKRREAGLCIDCGLRPHHLNTLKCVPCKTRQASVQEKYRRKRLAAGICLGCGNEKGIGQANAKYCDACRENRNAYSRKYYRDNLEKRICACCRLVKVKTDMTMCKGCLAYHSERIHETDQKRLRSGKCRYCGKSDPTGGRQSCDACREKMKVRQAAQYYNRQAAGLCSICGKAPPVTGQVRCETCRERDNDRRRRRANAKNEPGQAIPILFEHTAQRQKLWKWASRK